MRQKKFKDYPSVLTSKTDELVMLLLFSVLLDVVRYITLIYCTIV